MQLRSNTGNSLAEFAVVILLMAVLTGGGYVRYSQATERGRAKKSHETINKIAMAANNFFHQTNNVEGIGRFPGQEKWNRNVPDSGDTTAAGYASVADALQDLADGKFETYRDGNTFGNKWCSVFGKQNLKATILSEHANKLHSDDDGLNNGPAEWADFIDVMESPYLDGHYIYTVIGGNTDKRPAIIITDLFSPSADFIVFQP